MTPEDYRTMVNQLPCGKRLPKAIYIHKSVLPRLPEALQALTVQQSQTLKLDDSGWNVVKYHRDQFKLTLLSYPDFYDDAYPALHKSLTIDLLNQKCKETRYCNTDNPPILHRKETMILPENPHYEAFCHITQEGELAGLYENSRLIGFKRSWESLIESKGYTLVDGRLFRNAAINVTSPITIDRHKTALSRDDLSTPMKALARNGYLEGQFSIFDYGCGHGDDLRELEAHGLSAKGWDPNWRPDTPKEHADLVNLGFVINVIESLEERAEALTGAWQLTDKLLVVAAMIASEQHLKKFKPFKDGVITSRNTFQKYYSQTELQVFIEQVLDEDPIAVGPGVYYIFKDKEEEQLYLASKQRRRSRWKLLSQKPVRVLKSQRLLSEHSELFETFWRRCLELGRLPAIEELEGGYELKSRVGSPQQAFKLACEQYDIDDFHQAENERREDLLIYFALQQFCKRRQYKTMPEQLKRDIKSFFGNYRRVIEESRALLFSLSRPELIHQACAQAHERLPASVLNPNHSLILHARFAQDLPTPLRVYIGCAAQLYGETDDMDLIKIHIRSGKLTLMIYDGFETQPIPMLKERIKINMRAGHTEFFDYGYGDYEPQPLYWKSQFIDESFSDYGKQKSFDTKLASLNIPEMSMRYGPSLGTLNEVLRSKHQLKIQGYRFFKQK